MSSILITLITSAVSLLIGIFFNRIFESKPRLITHYGHIAAGKIKSEQDNEGIEIFTHSVVVRNIGQKTANKLRIGHKPLMSSIENMVSIFPPTEIKIASIPNVGEEIVIEKLLPSQEIMLTYVYMPPLQFDKINTYVRSDEGSAKRVNVLLSKEYPLWFLNALRVLLFIGSITSIYFVILFFQKFYHCWVTLPGREHV